MLTHELVIGILQVKFCPGVSCQVIFYCSHVKYTPTPYIYSHKCNYLYPRELKGYGTVTGQVKNRTESGSSFEFVLIKGDKKSACYFSQLLIPYPNETKTHTHGFQDQQMCS